MEIQCDSTSSKYLKLKRKITSGTADRENLKPPHIAGGSIKCYGHFDKLFDRSSKC